MQRGNRQRGEAVAKVEITLLEPQAKGWRALAKPLRKVQPGEVIRFSDRLSATVAEKSEADLVLTFDLTGEDFDAALAEAGVDDDKLQDREELNPECPTVDVAVVIGANDVVNPAARRPGSPLYGMPILDVDKAKNVIVIKRGQGKGFAGVENELFYAENTRMLYGDAQKVLTELIQALKRL